MKLFAILLSFSFLLQAQAQGPKVASGRVVRFENFASKYVAPRTVDVWLPQGYSPQNKYAVLYMHDGQMLFDSTATWNHQEWGVDETVDSLTRRGQMRPTIVVGVWNGGKKRFAEYFPQKALQWVDGTTRRSLLAQLDTALANNYLHFLVTELKPFIDSAFSTHPDRANTFVAGSSMGGLISMYALCEYPAVFGGAACLSTHWPGSYVANDAIPNAFDQYLQHYGPAPGAHKLYFDYGTATLDSLYEPYQMRIDATMRRKGYGAANWMTQKFKGENHSERAWRRRLAIPLLFLLSAKK